MKGFWRFLLRKSLPVNSLAGASTAVFGLGDSGAVTLVLQRVVSRLQLHFNICCEPEAVLSSTLRRIRLSEVQCGRQEAGSAARCPGRGAGGGTRPGRRPAPVRLRGGARPVAGLALDGAAAAAASGCGSDRGALPLDEHVHMPQLLVADRVGCLLAAIQPVPPTPVHRLSQTRSLQRRGSLLCVQPAPDDTTTALQPKYRVRVSLDASNVRGSPCDDDEHEAEVAARVAFAELDSGGGVADAVSVPQPEGNGMTDGDDVDSRHAAPAHNGTANGVHHSIANGHRGMLIYQLILRCNCTLASHVESCADIIGRRLAPSVAGYAPSRPYMADVTVNDRLTAADHFQVHRSPSCGASCCPCRHLHAL